MCLVSSWRENSLGVFQPVILKTVRPGAILEIGDDVGISGASISASESIRIGNRVLIGSGALITDSDAHALAASERFYGSNTRTAPVVIEDEVFIGARTIILKGVRIGKGSVIGAGSVVARDVPAGVIAGGNPCQVIKSLGESA
jgi:acetyltransferase-like isoleucine patch superfamily enzyme